ncbi:hypothetical protein PVAP13_7KG344070 [Panicum virgatum]|uniref:Uncharacterized protein n=1 Tax=Panicum virgatum TaxID=38727 RepID=A0A8T0QHK2_PANVG|nr:hypothetical protein PVAP13_7KG344070 [Panicum virgatum]
MSSTAPPRPPTRAAPVSSTDPRPGGAPRGAPRPAAGCRRARPLEAHRHRRRAPPWRPRAGPAPWAGPAARPSPPRRPPPATLLHQAPLSGVDVPQQLAAFQPALLVGSCFLPRDNSFVTPRVIPPRAHHGPLLCESPLGVD